ncbi:hypothetical protein AWC38_SpisGene24595 [Stylophora pistillata]|uniref:Uncharacterized protein n=1 Tax=Stylophora pistillata TaxID=50429 RepID=A0A2B4R5V1_STYPI|nr:hypothetical protein AWC38_SpisGene24595 [Stylophora pistillata]
MGKTRYIEVVLREFYYKDVASRSVINARSALPWSCKRTILTQEVLRILLNCSRELRWEVVVAHFNHMMLRLQFSGYDQKFRKEVVRSALAAYNRLVELDANGEKPLYRPRGWKAHERARERTKRRDNWFRKGGYETVIFVPATPGSQIKRRGDAPMLTAFSAGLTERDHAEVRVDQKFRKEVVRSALAAYNRLVELDANGEKPLYRPRGWKAHERARERKKRRDNWFRKGGYETVIFVPATPGSQIKRWHMRKRKATEFQIKVFEQSATTLKAML